MPVFVTISEGPSAGQARPLLVLDDVTIARAVGQLIAERLGTVVPGTPGARHPTVVSLTTKPGRGDPGGT